MILVGVCGRSGSGKSTVLSLIKNKYPAFVDCDAVSRIVTKANSPCLLELADFFGKDILFQDGSLDRAKLASVAFGSKEKTAILNSVTHKYILEKTFEILKEYQDKGEKIAFIDAPTLFESGLDKKCDFILGVVANECDLKKRLSERDGKSVLEIEKRLSSQKSVEFIIENSHYVIKNDGSLSQLEEKVKMFLEFIEEKYDC